jgi:hypothetical protein
LVPDAVIFVYGNFTGVPNHRAKGGRSTEWTTACNPMFLSDFQRGINGGGRRIRTYGGDKPSTVFKTAAFDHSASPPNLRIERPKERAL